MDMNQVNVEAIVKQVLEGMLEKQAAPTASTTTVGGAIPKTARVAMLTALEHYDIKEYPIPELGDDDILVKVEGCGVCGTDAHEFKRDPFGLIPVVLGQGSNLYDFQGQSGHYHVRPEQAERGRR